MLEFCYDFHDNAYTFMTYENYQRKNKRFQTKQEVFSV